MESRDSVPVGRSVLAEAAMIGLLALTLNLAGNGRVSLLDRDEPRYAGCTREMRASGDWIHPTFNAEPRYHKPVLIYWLMLASTAIGGDNPFGARLVSAIAGTGTVMIVWAWGRRTLGARAGRFAALVLATAPIMLAESKLATTDATLAFWVVVCQFALWELAQRSSRWVAAVFWLALALAILTKSPAGPVLIAASAVASWWWGGPIGYWRRLHWRWGPLLALAVVAPWNVAILLRSHGAYYNVAVGYHIIRRATSGLEEHGGFPGYYLVTGLATFYPWSALLPAAVAAAWVKRRETPLAGYLLGWLIGPLVLLECVRTKLVHYYLPAIPAAALLVGWFLACVADDSVRASIKEWTFGRLAIRWFRGVGFLAAIGLAALAFALPPQFRAPSLLMAAMATVGTVFVPRAFSLGRTEAAVAVIILTTISLLIAAGWILPAAEPYRTSTVVGRRLAALEVREGTRAVLGKFQTPGTILALGHPAPIIRSRTEILDRVDHDGKVLTAITLDELPLYRKEASLAVEILETVKGFNLEKCRPEILYLALLRPSTLALRERPQAASPR